MAVLVISASAAVADYSLTILYTNDSDTRFGPVSKYDSGYGGWDNVEGRRFGGSVCSFTVINEARARSGNSILVDDGPEVLGSFADAVNFPILMSNAHISDEALLRDVTRKSVVIERGDQNIGLIGLTPQDTDKLAIPRPNVVFTDLLKPFREKLIN